MSKEATRIGDIISRLTNPADLVELVKMAQTEVLCGVVGRDLTRFDRGVAVYEAAREALGNANARLQVPRYTQAA